MNNKSICRILAAGLCIFLISCAFAGTGAAEQTSAGIVISDLTIYPGTLMPGESGTASVVLKNTGAYPVFTEGIIVYSSNGVDITIYDQGVGTINAGDSIPVAFSLKAKNEIGTFYPYITINYHYNPGNGNVHNYAKLPIAVVVDDKSISMSVLNRPDVFQPDTTQTLSLTIGNLRANDIEGVELSVSGKGVSSREGKVFVGEIPANSSQSASITVLTTEETDEVTITATYRNGANWHSESITLPIYAGISRTGADLVINNIETGKTSAYTTITGDVNNAGLTTAKAVVVSTIDTTEAGPYPEYVIGSLDTDGLSEFTVTFKSDAPVVTVLFTYKDAEGNTYIQTKDVTVNKAEESYAPSKGTGNDAVLPTVIILIIAAAALLTGIVAWRKGIFRKKNE